MNDILSRLTQKKSKLDEVRPLPPELVTNLDAWFRVELTYTSNAIEGNTLSRRETALVVEKGITVSGKTMREHLEAINHAEALDYIRTLVDRTPGDISQDDILQIHKLILSHIDDVSAEVYRRVPVRIQGANVILPSPVKVPELMIGFIDWLHAASDLHPVQFATEAHFRFVSIHPFVDGNGRTARLLMNLFLMQSGYPPAVVRKDDRETYIRSLETGQTGGSTREYYDLIYRAAERSLDMYLDAASGNIPVLEKPEPSLLKIGQVARESGESIHTIRHWTQKGLLEIAELTPVGYALYDRSMIARAQTIRNMAVSGLSLDRIKNSFN